MLKKVDACTLCKGNCWNCLYAEECGNWNDTDPCGIPQVKVEAKAEEKLSDLDIKQLNLYVTGLIVALIATLNSARDLGISVTLYHYNRETGEYYAQEVK